MCNDLSQTKIDAIIAVYELSNGVIKRGSSLLRKQGLKISPPTVRKYWVQNGLEPKVCAYGGKRTAIPVRSNLSDEEERIILRVYEHYNSVQKVQKNLIIYTQGQILGVLIKHKVVGGSLEDKVSH